MIDAGSFADYREALEIIIKLRMITTSSIQRRLRIGYTQACRIMDLLEENGIVGPPNTKGPRDILLTNEEIKALTKGDVGANMKTKAAKKEAKVTFLETPYDANLKVALTPDEVMAEAEKMARLQQEIKAKEDEAASVSKRYKSEIEGLICQQDTSAGLVRDKFTFKTIKCIRRLDWEFKTVTETRTDTGAIIGKRDMTVSECQMQMQLDENKEEEGIE